MAPKRGGFIRSRDWSALRKQLEALLALRLNGRSVALSGQISQNNLERLAYRRRMETSHLRRIEMVNRSSEGGIWWIHIALKTTDTVSKSGQKKEELVATTTDGGQSATVWSGSPGRCNEVVSIQNYNPVILFPGSSVIIVP